jgi:Myb/SANT-like DNA-binding domain
MHKNYKTFRALKEQSGFGWDEVEKLPTARDNVWDAYIEATS